MGNSGSNEDTISEEAVDEYAELTYLSRREIRQWVYEFTSERSDKVLIDEYFIQQRSVEKVIVIDWRETQLINITVLLEQIHDGSTSTI